MKQIIIIFTLCLVGILSYAQQDTSAYSRELQTVEIKDRSGMMQKDLLKSVHHLNSKEITQLNLKSTSDALAASGKVFVQKSQQGGGSPIIRGFEANKILLVVDNVRMNNAIYRGGHLQNIITISPYLLESIDLLQGPSSVYYGSDALGGSVVLKTKGLKWSNDDKAKYILNLHAEGGNQSLGKAHSFQIGTLHWAWTHAASYSKFFDLISGSKRSTDYPDFGKVPYKRLFINGVDSLTNNSNVNKQSPSGYTQFDIIEKIGYRSDKIGEHVLNIQYSNSSNVDRYDRLSEFNAGKPVSAQWYYGPQRRIFAAYEWDKNLSNNVQIKSQISHQNILESRHNRNWKNPWLKNRNETVDVTQWSLDLLHDLHSITLRYGMDYQWNKVKSVADQKNIITNEIKTLDTRYPDGGSNMLMAGIFGIIEKKWTSKFTTEMGLRYNYQTLNSKIKNPSVFVIPVADIHQQSQGLVYSLGFHIKPTNKTHISLLASSAYRSPNVDDLAKIFESTTQKLIIPNESLKAEKIYSQEVNLKQQIIQTEHQQLSLQISAYYALYKNAIITDVAKINGVDSIIVNGVTAKLFSNTNAREAVVDGLDFGINYNYNSKLLVSLNYTFTEGKITSAKENGLKLDHIPPAYGKININYMPCSKWTLNVNSIYNAWKRKADYNLLGEDNFQYATVDGMPSWYIINCGADYKLLTKLNIYAKIENLLDVHYRSFASGISGAGRTYTFGFKWTLVN